MHFHLIKENLTLLILISLISSCALQNNEPKPTLSTKEVASILNDGCTINRDRKERYKINGKRYKTLSSSRGFKQRGVASWYGSDFNGKLTACGERYNMYKYTAAHKTLPLPTYLNVQNLRNGKSVIVKVNDRGPFIDKRIIDLSYAAAKKINMLTEGTTFVKITAVSEQVAAQAMKKNDRGIFSSNLFEKIVLLNKNKIVLQIGAFTEEKGARELKKKVEKLGVNSVFITKIRSGRTTYYRVRIGPIKTLKSYERVISKLTSLSLDINIISE